MREWKKILEQLKQYRFALAALFCGILFLLLSPGDKKNAEQKSTAAADAQFTTAAVEREMESVLGSIDGVGRLRVMLTVGATERKDLAQDVQQSSEENRREADRETVIVSVGSGSQEAVVLQKIYPDYIGALIVCEGADSAGIRLRLTQAVSILTGLSSDKIAVVKGRPS